MVVVFGAGSHCDNTACSEDSWSIETRVTRHIRGGVEFCFGKSIFSLGPGRYLEYYSVLLDNRQNEPPEAA